MDERRELAAAALAEGMTIEEVAKVVGRKPRTVTRWLSDPEVQAYIVRSIRGVAVLTLAQSLKDGGDLKTSQVAVSILRWLGVGKPRSGRKVEPTEEDETDLGEFSEESLRRLKGDG